MARASETDPVSFYERAARKREKQGVAAKPGLTKEYGKANLEGASGDAFGLSFGCGDPLAFAAVREGDTVVDLGCGAGLDLLIAAEKVGPGGRVIGVDAGAEMLARAAANAKNAGFADRIELIEGKIEALSLADASVDWAISNCVLNLASDKAKVFAEIVRVLKPGGGILIADLVVNDLPDWVRTYSEGRTAWLRGVVSEDEYKQCAEKAGLVEAEIVGRTPFDAGMTRVLIKDELPVALNELAARFKMDKHVFLDMASSALAGRIVSIKLRAKKP